MENHEMYDTIDNNGINRYDKFTIFLNDGRILVAEFIEHVDSCLRVKVELNKRPYMTKVNGEVEMWQFDIQDLKIPVKEIKNI